MIQPDQDPSPQEDTPMWCLGTDQHLRLRVITTYGPEGRRVKPARAASAALALAPHFAAPLQDNPPAAAA